MPPPDVSDQTVSVLEWIGRGVAAVLIAAGAAWQVLSRRRKPRADGPTRAGVAPAKAARQARVVIVENHDILLDLLVRWLRDAGFEVIGEAASLEEAMRLPFTAADAAVVDLKLNGGPPAGLDVLRRYREECPDMILIAMSGYDDHRTAAIKAGADEFFAKGSPAGDVVHLLNRLLAERAG
jgi:ActR/RegA family two-component response regulator